MAEEDLMLRVEAVLMTTDRPLGERRIATILDLEDDDSSKDGVNSVRRIRDAIESLNESYEATDRSFRIERVAGGLQVMTLPDYAEDIARLQDIAQMRNTTWQAEAAAQNARLQQRKVPVAR